jgi:N-acetylneuraminic acid mutarotase
MNADGSSQVNLTHSCGEDLNPAWAPDGTQIVFESDRIDPNLYDVFVMNADGSGQQSVTRMADPFNPSLYNEPKWSPDGRKIAFTPYSWYFDIWTINPDGSDLKRLTHNSSAVLVGQPSWSTDGSKIIYTANLGDGWGNWEIYTVNADGSGPVNLTHNPGIDLKPHCQKRLAPSPPSPTPSPTSAPAPTPVSTDDTWTAISLTNAPDRRHYHTAVWTGSEMIVWGGYGNGSLTDGARYNPNSNTWAPISTTNAPSPTERSTAIWTGSEMIVWGSDHYGNVAYGGRYDPKTDTWTSISSLNAPRPRSYHTAVWTGTEMIVWGGHYWSSNGYPQSVNTGGRYNPTTDTWIPTSTVTVPTARSYHTAIWNGNEMIVWGGDNGFADSSVNTGGRYNPVTDTWIATPSTNAPDPRQEHTAVWTGNEMIVWGGVFQQYSSLPAPMNTGAKYNPVTNNWITTSTINSPQPRYRHRAVWTGYEMIVWGGQDLAGFNSGSRYNPLTDTWTGTSKGDSPHPRQDHTAIWTGSEMIIWGGENLSPPALNTGARYNASQPPPPNPLGR